MKDNNNLTIKQIKTKYNIQDNNIISRLILLKQKIESKKQGNINYDELLTFLQGSMNYDNMQLWIMKKESQDIKLTLSNKLKKFFEIKTDDEILSLYDIEQNYDENNIGSFKRKLKKKIIKYYTLIIF